MILGIDEKFPRFQFEMMCQLANKKYAISFSRACGNSFLAKQIRILAEVGRAMDCWTKWQKQAKKLKTKSAKKTYYDRNVGPNGKNC